MRSLPGFSRPFGTLSGVTYIPALKRWAIFICPSGTSISEFPKGIAAHLTSCPRLADEPAQTEERRQYPAGCRSAAAGVPDAAVVYLD